MIIKKFLNTIKLKETLLKLPFAYTGLLFAGSMDIYTWIWVTIGLISAGTAGIIFNRIFDSKIDTRNPESSEQSNPSGDFSGLLLWTVGIINSLVLVSCSYMLNELCFYLSFVCIFLLITHPFLKRISWTSHFYIGLVEAIAPVGGYIAETGRFDILPFVLGAAVLIWIAGLDIFYAIQNIDFHNNENLNSIPLKFGKEKAMLIFLIFYIISLGAFLAAGILTYRGLPYWVAVVCVSIIFVKQQHLARSKDIKAAVIEFFQVNNFISPILFVGIFIDVVMN